MKPPVRLRGIVVACALVTVALAVYTRGGDEAWLAGKIAAGQIYSTDDGDPIDVSYGPDESGRLGCMSVSVSFNVVLYGGSSVSCFDPVELEEGGTYKLIIPGLVEMPALVVGVMPAGATGATVGGIGRKTARAETRGRWFLASLEPTDPSPWDLADIRVEFDP